MDKAEAWGNHALVTMLMKAGGPMGSPSRKSLKRRERGVGGIFLGERAEATDDFTIEEGKCDSPIHVVGSGYQNIVRSLQQKVAKGRTG